MYSPCKRLEVWAYGIDRNNKEHSVYNGNLGECTGEEGNCGCTHAEARLLKEMKQPPLTVVVSHSPCLKCAKLLVSAGVESILYEQDYRLSEGIEYLKDKGVHVSQKTMSTLLIYKVQLDRIKYRYGG